MRMIFIRCLILLPMERTDQLMAFMREAAKHHLVLRQIWCPDQQRQESDSEHAWHVALFIMLLGKDYPQLNMEKMLKMALIHDLAEVYAGDFYVLDKKGREGKKEREQKAWETLCAQLPQDLGIEFQQLITEYEAKQSPEAKLVNACDKLQPTLMNLCSEGKSWKKHHATQVDISSVKLPALQHDPKLLEMYETVMQEARKRALLS